MRDYPPRCTVETSTFNNDPPGLKNGMSSWWWQLQAWEWRQLAYPKMIAIDSTFPAAFPGFQRTPWCHTPQRAKLRSWWLLTFPVALVAPVVFGAEVVSFGRASVDNIEQHKKPREGRPFACLVLFFCIFLFLLVIGLVVLQHAKGVKSCERTW